MNKQDFKRLKLTEEYAAECQVAADQMARRIISARSFIELDQKCDFNLFWLYDCSPEVLIHTTSVEFLADNIDKFKRKLSIREMIKYDGIIVHREIKDFNHFKNMLSNIL
jgi:hypothetical protein